MTEDQPTTALELMRLARSMLSSRYPYFAAALWTLRLVEKDIRSLGALGDFAVDDHWNMYFDPKATMELRAELGMDALLGILLHELSHVVRRHGKRAKFLSAEQVCWNVAADLAINQDVLAEGLKLPEGALRLEQFNFPAGLSAEEYYKLLEKHATKVRINCGSGAHGNPEKWEEGEGEGAPSAFEREAAVRETARRIKEAGSVAAGWKRWAEAEFAPQINWRHELASMLRSAVLDTRGRADFTYMYPSRRQSIFKRVVLPAMTESTAKPALVFDTSGSMGQEELNLALSEAKGVLMSLGYREAYWVSVDVQATSGKLRNLSDIDLQGGGGTDMRVGIKEAEKFNPAVTLVFTDCYSPWPEKPTKTPLVVVAIGDGASISSCPKWAKVVHVRG